MNYFIITLIILLPYSLSQFSPLRLQQQIVIKKYSSSQHAFYYPISKLQFINTLFCLMPMQVNANNTNTTTMTECNLINQTLDHMCFRLYAKQDQDQTENSLAVESLYLNLESKNIVMNIKKQSQILSGRILQSLNDTVTLISKANQQTIIFNSKQFQDKFVQLISCEQYNSDSQSCNSFWKTNYLTFHDLTFTGNILVQRYHACGIQNNKEVHVFYGGIIRQQQKYMVIGIVSLNKNNTWLNMWGGIGYSNDHASRDMFCYNNKDEGADSISFVAQGVYKDTNQHIGATQDTTIFSNSSSKSDKSSHFIEYYRKYDTQDFSGDEKIRQIIYGKYSFAGYFQQTNKSLYLSCFSSTYKHNFVYTFTSNIDLAESNTIFLLGILMILFYYI